jgi:hypothetical protein
MGQSDISFAEVCTAYGFSTEDGLDILKKEFNRRVNNSYGNFIMTTLIDEAFEDQKKRSVEINKNRALIPILPLLCHYANCYPTEIDSKTKKRIIIKRLHKLTKKISKGYVPISLGDRGKSAMEEWNKIIIERFKNKTFLSDNYQEIIKTLLKRYDTVKRKVKVYNTWKKDFVSLTKFNSGLKLGYTFEELEKHKKPTKKL